MIIANEMAESPPDIKEAESSHVEQTDSGKEQYMQNINQNSDLGQSGGETNLQPISCIHTSDASAEESGVGGTEGEQIHAETTNSMPYIQEDCSQILHK